MVNLTKALQDRQLQKKSRINSHHHQEIHAHLPEEFAAFNGLQAGTTRWTPLHCTHLIALLRVHTSLSKRRREDVQGLMANGSKGSTDMLKL